MKLIISPLHTNQGSYKVYASISQQNMKRMIMCVMIILAMAMMVAWGLLTRHEYRWLALIFFEYQIVDRLHAGLLDLDANEFQSFSQRSPLFGLDIWIRIDLFVRALIFGGREASWGPGAKLCFLVSTMGHV
jgi:hypothetical protein